MKTAHKTPMEQRKNELRIIIGTNFRKVIEHHNIARCLPRVMRDTKLDCIRFTDATTLKHPIPSQRLFAFASIFNVKIQDFFREGYTPDDTVKYCVQRTNMYKRFADLESYARVHIYKCLDKITHNPSYEKTNRGHLDGLGMSRQSISRYCNNDSHISAELLYVINEENNKTLNLNTKIQYYFPSISYESNSIKRTINFSDVVKEVDHVSGIISEMKKMKNIKDLLAYQSKMNHASYALDRIQANLKKIMVL